MKTLINDLQSSQETQVRKALGKVQTQGDVSIISILIDLWDRWDNKAIKKEVETILFGLKAPESIVYLIEYISAQPSATKRLLALSAIWQSGLDASPYLTQLIDFSLTGDYPETIDIMTIIENSAFDESQDELIDLNLKKINDHLLRHPASQVKVLMEIRSILIDKKIEG